MISAGRVYDRIEAGIAEVRREETRLAEQIPALGEEVAELQRGEVDLLRALAAMRLDALQRDEITGHLDSAERQALAVLDANRARLGEIEGRRAQIADALERAEADRAALDRAVEMADAALDAQAEATEQHLVGEPDWLAASEASTRSTEQADGADRKAERAEADRAEKAAAYDGDPLFSYLWARHFGTSDYRASNLVKYVDGKVARLVGYTGARADYHRLTAIPRRLRAHADRLAADADAAQAALMQIERAALEADGIGALETALAEQTASLEAAEAEIDQLEAEHDGLDGEAAELMNAEGEGALSTALSGLAASLGDRGVADLANATAATADPEDDRIVAQLSAVRTDIAEAERALRGLEAERAGLVSRRRRLEEERRRFRNDGYASPGGSFENSELIGELVGGLVRGAIAGGLADALSKGYRKPRRKGRASFGGGVARPRRGGSSSSSGGFRTGGGF
ncbi:MAG: hypothetical protein AAGC57_00215 [Pseudomonadota bacterium]